MTSYFQDGGHDVRPTLAAAAASGGLIRRRERWLYSLVATVPDP